jgi:hypothetical protein
LPNLSNDSSTHCPIADPHQPSSPSVCVSSGRSSRHWQASPS